MPEKNARINVPGAGAITAIRTTPAQSGRWTLIYAPGAGSNVNDPFGVHASRALAEKGVTCVRFQFPYQEAGRSGPDRPPVLEAAWSAVIESIRGDADRLCIG